MTAQPRKPVRAKFLNAPVVPVENALLARAENIETRAEHAAAAEAKVLKAVAVEFRALADELHWW